MRGALLGFLVAAVIGGAGLGPAQGSASRASAPRRQIEIAPNSYAQERLQVTTAPTVVWSSIVRRGKSYGACMKAFETALALPGIQIALTRLERASMDESTLVSMRKLLGIELYDALWNKAGDNASCFVFPRITCDDGVVRQSKIAVFGLLDPGRKLSTEYGLFIVDQAEQIERQHLALMQTRLNFSDPWIEQRAAELGMTVRQMIMICNADDPEHWLNVDYEIESKGMREERDPKTGKVLYEVILSEEKDNAENLTEDYSDRLASLFGTVWYDRLVKGRWVRAEGLVYGQHYSPLLSVIDRPKSWARWGGNPPPDWPRYRSFDFGTNNPFVVHWWAGLGSGSREQLICYREGYGTDRAPSDWARWIVGQERAELLALRRGLETEDEAWQYRAHLRSLHITESWSDHDLAWRNELAKHGVWTKPAVKDIEAGIPVMQGWLRDRRMLFVRGMLAQDPDARLLRDKAPTSIIGEFGRYRWHKRSDTQSESSADRFNVPVDRDNHGCDSARYMVVSHGQVRRVGVFG